MIKIRRIRSGESELYRKIRLEALKESPQAYGSTYESSLKRSRDSWLEQADGGSQGPDRAIFFALLENQPVGLAALYRMESHKDLGELMQVWVRPAYRRQGVAVVLMDAVFEWASGNNYRAITAGIMPGNASAMKFYQNYGFVPEDGMVLDCPDDAATLIKDVT